MPNFRSANRNKRVQGTNQATERTDSPISSVPITEMKKTQGNSEEDQKSTEAEKKITSQSNGVKTDEKLRTTSEATEKKLEEKKTADRRRPEKRKEKKSGEGDNDSQVSSNSRSSGRNKRQTQFWKPTKTFSQEHRRKTGTTSESNFTGRYSVVIRKYIVTITDEETKETNIHD